MESFIIFIYLLFIVFGILQIILFFKIWGMTNNVNEIKNIIRWYIKEQDAKQPIVESESDIRVEDLVVELKNERQLKVVAITNDGKFQCILPGGISPIGIFNRDEIELFNRYWHNKSQKA